MRNGDDDEKDLLLYSSDQEYAFDDDDDEIDSSAGAVPAMPRVRQGLAALFVAMGLGVIVATSSTIVHVRQNRLLAGSTVGEQPRPPHHLVTTLLHGISAAELLAERDLAFSAADALQVTASRSSISISNLSIRTLVSEALHNASQAIEHHTPLLHHALKNLWLRPAEHEAVLHVVSHMSDAELQRLGFDIAGAIRRGEQMGPEGVMHHLLLCLQDNDALIRELRQRIVPSTFQQRAVGKPSLMNLHVMDSFASLPAESDRQLKQLVAAGSSRSVLHLQAQSSAASGVIGGVIEELRVVFDVLRSVSAVQADALPPRWSRSIVGGGAFAAGLVECISDGMKGTDLAVMCPMRFASASIDVLHNLRNVEPSSDGSVR